MRDVRAVLAALVRLHGWDAVNDQMAALRPVAGHVERAPERIAADAARIAPPTDLDRARARQALRRTR